MRQHIERLLERYEGGSISRRTFVQSLTALATTTTFVPVEAPAPLFKPVNLNHITIAVSDLDRTRVFYESVLGLTPYKRNEIGLFLGVGEHFVGVDLASKAKEKVGIDHFCVGVENFDEANARKILGAQSIHTFAKFGSGVHFHDPDGITVQVSAPSYR
jgi:catechol 2,3-dioxygenase-like lactoylglutathione lyase family enzyme